MQFKKLEHGKNYRESSVVEVENKRQNVNYIRPSLGEKETEQAQHRTKLEVKQSNHNLTA